MCVLGFFVDIYVLVPDDGSSDDSGQQGCRPGSETNYPHTDGMYKIRLLP